MSRRWRAVVPMLLGWLVLGGLGNFGCTEERYIPRPYPEEAPPPGRLMNSASFLMDDLKLRIMNSLSLQIDRNEFERRIAACVANGDDTIALFLTNRGDGTPPITSFYADDEYCGSVDHDKVDEMTARLRICRDNGLRPHLWVWADDSGFQDYPEDRHREHLSRCVELFDEYAAAWCVGLELDEWLREASSVRVLTEALQEITNRPVGVHFTRLSKWDWTITARADILFGQYGFGLSAEDVRSATAQAIEQLDGRAHFWAWEYHKSAETAEAKALGDAAMSVDGCLGTGCGRNR